jgi:hypothetical protein
MNRALVSSLHAALEPISAMAVSVLNPSRLVLDVSVSVTSCALNATLLRRANRRPGKRGLQRGVCRTTVPSLLRDAHPQQVSVLTRAATFSWNGVAPRRWLPEVDCFVIGGGRDERKQT